jgi:hypothetical protein
MRGEAQGEAFLLLVRVRVDRLYDNVRGHIKGSTTGDLQREEAVSHRSPLGNGCTSEYRQGTGI